MTNGGAKHKMKIKSFKVLFYLKQLGKQIITSKKMLESAKTGEVIQNQTQKHCIFFNYFFFEMRLIIAYLSFYCKAWK